MQMQINVFWERAPGQRRRLLSPQTFSLLYLVGLNAWQQDLAAGLGRKRTVPITNWKACFLTAQKKNRNSCLTRLGKVIRLNHII